ncbi:MAG TPA: NAD-dependent epimerase/dehydratase family protein [Terriglobales bacterium]|nr:NAD-dependent epimerase/dehydratase family protein [Terriglobales bacterium]
MNGNFWLDRPVLVTGASGFLGSWLTRRLRDRGADVICLLRDWVPQSELVRSHILENVKVVRGDIRDPELLERTLGEYQVDTVFHLAAQTQVVIANRNPVSTLETNIRGTWNLLEACRRSPTVKSIVVASSDKAYGSQDELPYAEEAPLRAEYPYDVSKSCADLIAHTYAKSYQLPAAVTRCGNLYGGGDLNWNRIVPGTIRSILRGQRPVVRSDGQLVRDYFYVEDAAAAYMLLAEAVASDPTLGGMAFNFSNETGISVLDLVKKIVCQMGSPLTPEVRNDATNEIRVQYLSAKRARRMFNWAPLFSLDEGLKRTITWYKEFLAS